MMNTVKHAIYTIGDRGSDLAKTIGCETADLAKRVGGTTADLAKRAGSSTSDLAKRIGPKRGLIGLAVLAAAIGGSIVLVRYLKARGDGLDATDDLSVDG